ncbi:MAG TPA: type II secretion system F family protein [Candidatus Saccharimonadales bacterium]|nr:type II secretion system F family protein [Candidatus Saccharimonadales bacterium]
MATFSYTAQNPENKTVHGTIEAINREAAVASLDHQRLQPISVQAMGAKEAGKKKKRKKVKTKDLVVFTRQLSTMVSAGVPLTKSLATLQSQTQNKSFKIIIGQVAKDVESGQPLADGFAKHPYVFSEVYINMVRAGESGGILDEILKRLASQVERDSSMRKKIKGAMAYPMAILTITVVAFFGIMIFIMPRISQIMKDLGGEDAQLPIYTRLLLGTSSFMQKNAIFIFIILGFGIWGFLLYIKTPNGKYKFHQVLLKIPVINNIIVKIAIARFARTFASLMAAGVSVLSSLEVTGGAIGNKVIEAELKEAAKGVRNGRQLSESLSASKNFPPIIPQMLAVGEETGQIDSVLVKVADFYEEEVTNVVDNLSSILEPIMIVILGAGVGLIAASVMGPIANLSKNIGGS